MFLADLQLHNSTLIAIACVVVIIVGVLWILGYVRR